MTGLKRVQQSLGGETVSLSKKFSINASVRQGGLLSPVFIAIYVDTLIQNLKQTDVGYNINGQFFGCFFMLMI